MHWKTLDILPVFYLVGMKVRPGSIPEFIAFSIGLLTAPVIAIQTEA
jgi:hypothetical protein